MTGPKEELDSTVISQPAIFVSSMAALEKLKVEDPSAIESATVAMGLSLGREYCDWMRSFFLAQQSPVAVMFR